MRLLPHIIFIEALSELRPFYLPDADTMPKEEARKMLVRITRGQDFGYDQEAWLKWCSENPQLLYGRSQIEPKDKRETD
jgi:hypothetical protein